MAVALRAAATRAATPAEVRARRRRSTVRAPANMAFSRCCSRAKGVRCANASPLRNALAAPTVQATKSATRERNARMVVAIRRAASATAAVSLVAASVDRRCVWPSAAAMEGRVWQRATRPRANATARIGPAKTRQEAPQSPPVPKLVLPRDSSDARVTLLVAIHLHRSADVHDLIAIRPGRVLVAVGCGVEAVHHVLFAQ